MANNALEVKFIRDGETVTAHDTKTGVKASGTRKSEAVRKLSEALEQHEE